MTARPQDVALLPCPFCGGVAEFDSPSVVYGVPWHSIRCCIAKAGGHDRGDVIRRWNTRANVTAALASARAREEELRADRDSWAQQASDRAADWHAEHQRAERLEEALRQARDAVADAANTTHGICGESQFCDSCHAFERANQWRQDWNGGDPLIELIDAALSTNAATQTGERT